MSEPIPLARPLLGEREEELVLEVLRSGRLSLGPMLQRFERAFADHLGVAEHRPRERDHVGLSHHPARYGAAAPRTRRGCSAYSSESTSARPWRAAIASSSASSTG